MNNSFTEFLNGKYSINAGVCNGELLIRNDLGNPIGSTHGGVLFAFGDETAGLLVMNECQLKATTIDASFHYLSPCMGIEKIESRAHIIKRGKRVVVVQVDIFGADKQLCTGIYSYMLLA